MKPCHKPANIRPSFTQFKDNAYLADLWEKYGNTNVATWEQGDSMPRAIAADRRAWRGHDDGAYRDDASAQSASAETDIRTAPET
ncbi:MAG TPA: hypothetical protein VIK28_06025, partial [Sedimentisphaerales bacterium]